MAPIIRGHETSVGHEDQHQDEAEAGPLGGAGGGRFHEPVLGEQLHDESGHRHGGTGENQRDGAGGMRVISNISQPWSPPKMS